MRRATSRARAVLQGGLALAAAACGVLAGCGSGEQPAAAPVRDLFPITPWEIQAEKQALLDDPTVGIASLRACGFDTVAFVRPDQLEAVERAEMQAIVGRPAELRTVWRDLSDRQIVERVEELVDASGDSDALIGYFVADEPGAADFTALGKAVAAVKRLAPGKLAYVNLLPSYATRAQLGTRSYAEYLRRYLAVVKPQVLSYGNFGVMYSQNLRDRARAGAYFRNLLSVRSAALAKGIPFWTALSSNQARPTAATPTPANLRLQAFTALAAGARGLSWFTYYEGRYAHAPIDGAGRRTATWTALRRVNAQVAALRPVLRTLRSTRVWFTAPAPAAGLPAPPPTPAASIRAPAALMVGELRGPGGRRFALVVNLSATRSTRATVVAAGRRVLRVSPADGSLQPLAAGGVLRLAPGEGALLRL